ncbi:MAG TPA: CHASE domain-containing protein, partial [Holophagaceae bacterium]
MQLTPPSSPPIGLRPRGPTLGVLVVGLLCTLGLYLWNRHSQELQDQARIRRYTERVETALLNRMGRYEDMVRGAQGFFAQDRDIQPEEWADYVQHLDIAQRHPGLSSLAYIVPVPHADLEDYLARHAELSGKYHLPHADPAYLGDPAEDGVHFLIQLCEPAAQSPGAVGLDVGASRTQRLTAVRARDTGGPALSGLLFFTNGTLRQEAVAFYLPVYRTRALPATEADRRAALKGWVSAGILIRPLVRDILKDEDTGLTFEITDPFSAQGPRWLYVSPDWPINTPPAVVHDLDVAGRDWRMQYALRPAFYRTEGRRRPEWMLLAGLIVTLSLTAGMASLTGTRARALELAGRMTESLHQALVRNRSHMENTPMAVVETDADFLIQEWNPAAERIFGYSRAEVLGRDPRFLVPDEEQASLDRRRKTLQEELGKGVRVTLQVKRPSGEIRLCDWTITALRDERG